MWRTILDLHNILFLLFLSFFLLLLRSSFRTFEGTMLVRFLCIWLLSHQMSSHFLLFLLHSRAISLWFTSLGEIFLYVTVFQSNHWGSHILSLWLVHAGCVFVAGIHQSRIWMSGSFESVWWNACVHRLDLGLYSHPKEFWDNGVRAHVNSKGKKSLPEKFSSVEDWTRNAALCRTASPTRFQLSYSVSGPSHFLTSVLPCWPHG